MSDYADLRREVVALRAENERLREALKNIREAEAAFVDQIARAALERKPE